MALGRTVIALQYEYPTLVHHDDGRSWMAFAMREAYMNIALVQDGDESYIKSYMQKALDTRFEHFFVLCGEAIQHKALFDEKYGFDCDMPIMGADLADCAEYLKYDDRIVICTRADREKAAELLAEGFDTTVEAELAMASADGHASPLVVGFKIEEDGVMLGHVAIAVAGEYVGVWALAVSEKARRRGLATTLFNHCLKYSQTLGAKYGVLLASDEGACVYERLGWKRLESVPLYFTADSYVRIPGFTPNIIRPFLRIEHGHIAADILKEVHGGLRIYDELNWFCSPNASEPGYALVQNAEYDDVISHARKIADTGRSAELVLAGPAAKYVDRLIQDICELYPHGVLINSASSDSEANGAVSKSTLDESFKSAENYKSAFRSGQYRAMVYDLLNENDKIVYSDEPADPHIRRGTLADRVQVSNVLTAAFNIVNDDPNWISPYSYGAGHENPNIYNWVYEIGDQKKEIIAVVTVVVRNRIVHIWGVATRPDHQRKGLGSLLMKHAVRQARKDTNARIGFLMATVQGSPVYPRLGWQIIEDWPEIIINGKD